MLLQIGRPEVQTTRPRPCAQPGRAQHTTHDGASKVQYTERKAEVPAIRGAEGEHGRYGGAAASA